MKRKLFFVYFISGVILSLQGQVTIGSPLPPEEASVLDLKTKKTDNLGVNSDKGLLMPKVYIQDASSLIPFVVSETPEIRQKHRGLVVYNLNGTNNNLSEGLVVWDGSGWRSLSSVKSYQNAPVHGQVLRFDDTTKENAWSTLRIPKVKTGGFYLQQTVITKDADGKILPYMGAAYESYPENLVLNGTSKNWVEFESLATEIEVPLQPNASSLPLKNRLIFNLQTGAQVGNIGASVFNPKEFAFAIGIFMQAPGETEYKLKQIRAFRLMSYGNYSFDAYTIMGSVDNLASGIHKIKIAAKFRATTATVSPVELAIGRNANGATNYSPFMGQTNFMGELYLVEDNPNAIF